MKVRIGIEKAMAAYTKAWLIHEHDGLIGIAYERGNGIEGCLKLTRYGAPELPELMKLLSDADLKTVEQRLRNIVPFDRTLR